MLAVLLAAGLTVPTYTNQVCVTCKGVGRVELTCPACNGKGQFTKVRKGSSYGGIYYFTPCSKCVKGLAGPQQKGTGKISVKCPDCNGRKYKRVRVDSPILNKND